MPMAYILRKIKNQLTPSNPTSHPYLGLPTPCFATKGSMHFSNMCAMYTVHLILFDLIILATCGKGKDHEASPYAIFLITQHNQNLFSLVYC